MNKTTYFLAALALVVGVGGGLLIRAAFYEKEPANSHKMPTSQPSTQTSKPVSTAQQPANVSAKIHDLDNKLCPIMKNPVKPDSFSIDYNGVLVRFCCPGCDGGFLERPQELLKEMKVAGAKVPDWALTENANPSVIEADNSKCPVMGNDTEGSKLYVVFRGVKVKLCCSDCRESFQDEPGKYLSKAAESGSIPPERLTGEYK